MLDRTLESVGRCSAVGTGMQALPIDGIGGNGGAKELQVNNI